MSYPKLSEELILRCLRRFANLLYTIRGAKGRICILSYHRVLERPDPLLPQDPDVTAFRWQMNVLARHFNVLSLAEVVAAIEQKRIPPRAVAITFDDGYRSIFDLAMPILKEFNLPATVFISSGFVGQEDMWNDRVIEAVRQFGGKQIDLENIGLGTHLVATAAERHIACKNLIASLKYLPQEDRSAQVLAIESELGVHSCGASTLTPQMLKRLIEGNIEIGAHTVNHPILENLSDEDANNEISQSKKELEHLLSRPVQFFAYPNGKKGVDFSERHCQMVEGAGFRAGFAGASSTAASSTSDRNLYKIPRCQPWDKTPITFSLRLLRWLSFGGVKDD